MQRMMRSRSTTLGTVAGMTALIGMLPLLITLGVTQVVPSLGAMMLTVIHIALMACGAWAFAALFGN